MMLSFEGVTIRMGDQVIIRDLSFNVKKGEHSVITGPSGSGKTTVLLAFLGFSIPGKGVVRAGELPVTAENIHRIRHMLGYVPQEIPFRFERTGEAIERIKNYRANKEQFAGTTERDRLMDALNLEKKLLNRTFEEISGGQKQRFGILIPLLTGKKTLLLDEPTSALDAGNRNILAKLLLNDEFTILSASHDEKWISCFNNVISLK